MNAKQRQLRYVDYLAHMFDAIRQARGYVEGLDEAGRPIKLREGASSYRQRVE